MIEWHTTNTGNEQGLILDDKGKNIAVAYNKKNAPLIAAAPNLLKACEEASDFILSTSAWIEGTNVIDGKARKTLKTIDNAIAEAEGND